MKTKYKNITLPELHKYLEKSYSQYQYQKARILTMFTSIVSWEWVFPNHFSSVKWALLMSLQASSPFVPAASMWSVLFDCQLFLSWVWNKGDFTGEGPSEIPKYVLFVFHQKCWELIIKENLGGRKFCGFLCICSQQLWGLDFSLGRKCKTSWFVDLFWTSILFTLLCLAPVA